MARPSVFPAWTDGNASKQVEPSSGKKALGWTLSERPPFQTQNWLHWLVNEWLVYLDGVTTGSLAAYKLVYDAVVGSESGCTHATLAAALADSAITSGMTILVLDSATINTTIQITKNNIKIIFKSGVTYSHGTAATCIQVSATGVNIYGGRFSSFTTAILIDSGSTWTRLVDNNFAGNTADITDNDSTGTAYGQIHES